MPDALPIQQPGANTINLGSPDAPVPNWQLASRHVRMALDGVCVEMDPWQGARSDSPILLSDSASNEACADTGTVLAAGPQAFDVKAGDRVCLLAYEGKYFRRFAAGLYWTKNRVRLLGVASMNQWERKRKRYWEIIVAKILSPDDPETVFTGVRLKPINRWVLIKRDPQISKHSELELPDNMKYRTQRATVIAAGSKVGLATKEHVEAGMASAVGEAMLTYRPGDTVIYQGKALVIDFEFGEAYGLKDDPKAYCLIDWEDLHCVIDDELNEL